MSTNTGELICQAPDIRGNSARGHNWARWLLLAWLAFHVVVSALHSLFEFIPHVVLLMIFGYFLFGPPGSKYFQSVPSA